MMNDEMAFSVTHRPDEALTDDEGLSGGRHGNDGVLFPARGNDAPSKCPDVHPTLCTETHDGLREAIGACQQREGGHASGTDGHSAPALEEVHEFTSLVPPTSLSSSDGHPHIVLNEADDEAFCEKGGSQNDGGFSLRQISSSTQGADGILPLTGLAVPQHTDHLLCLPALDEQSAEEALSSRDWLDVAHAMTERR